MKIVPHIFVGHPKIVTLLLDGNAAVFFKRVDKSSISHERYVSAHAITYVLKGQLKVEDRDGNLTVVNAGQMVLLPKGIYFISDFLPGDGPFEALVTFFPDQMLEDWAGEPETTEKSAGDPHPYRFACPERLAQFCHSMISIYQPPDRSNDPMTRAKLAEFLHLLGNSANGPAVKEVVQDLAYRERRSIMHLMRTHFDKPLGVEDYAYLSGRSISTFQREFKRLYGSSPKKWLIEERLKKAEELFRTSSLSVSEVAGYVGYEDLSHFSKAFRKRFGHSPKQFAMRQRRVMEG